MAGVSALDDKQELREPPSTLVRKLAGVLVWEHSMEPKEW